MNKTQMKMNKRSELILKCLKKYTRLSDQEMSFLLHTTRSGIRFGISDLRKQGYDIQLEKVEVSKYVLKKKEESYQTADKIIEWIKEKNNFGKKINLDDISTDLGLPLNKVLNGMSKVFKKYNVIQLSNKLVLVRPPLT